MDAAYGDPKLRAKLQSGKKIHALFGLHLFPGKTYEEIMASKGEHDNVKNLYDRSKRGVFGIAYGGNEHTLMTRVGISEEGAIRGYKSWIGEYKVWAAARERDQRMFCSMTQPGGIGTQVVWKDPAEYIESLFGFRRYFHLENQIVKVLFDLANDPPKDWKYYKVKVVRRDREQTASGASRSALFAAAFNVQASNMRAAGNHRIQSSGATLTKGLQRVIWDLQPCGINRWHVQPMNIHDEVMCPALKHLRPVITKVVNNFVESYRDRVPLIEIDWGEEIQTWADK
jgi:DNA polymerase I-like protein with 3'-5' exonuclease and polymerase domains